MKKSIVSDVKKMLSFISTHSISDSAVLKVVSLRNKVAESYCSTKML